MKKNIAALFIFIMCVVLAGCSSTDYNNALAHMEKGEYDEAAAIFEELNFYKDSAEKLVYCSYEAGKAAAESGEWDKAIEFLKDLKYNDSEKLYEQCKIRKGMDEKADSAFLEALEECVRWRMNYGDEAVSEVLSEREYYALFPFKEEEFYQKDIRKAAKDFIAAADRQIDALYVETRRCSKQLIWTEALVEQYAVLNTLYENYGFMADDSEFVNKYIDGRERIEKLLKMYTEINIDLFDDFSNINYYEPDGNDCYAEFVNNTDYEMTVKFYFQIHSEDYSELYLTTADKVQRIKPNSEYRVTVYGGLDVPYGIVDPDWEIVICR